MGINVKDARWPGCSAENFGRFIPCRGGGTATTYYTDGHEVDEDERTISIHGGSWDWETAGIAQRHISDNPNTSWIINSDVVASRLIYLS